jgi:hypothetical protein
MIPRISVVTGGASGRLPHRQRQPNPSHEEQIICLRKSASGLLLMGRATCDNQITVASMLTAVN